MTGEHLPGSPEDDFVEGHRLEGPVEDEQAPDNVASLEQYRQRHAGNIVVEIEEKKKKQRLKVAGTIGAVTLAVGVLYAVKKRRHH